MPKDYPFVRLSAIVQRFKVSAEWPAVFLINGCKSRLSTCVFSFPLTFNPLKIPNRVQGSQRFVVKSKKAFRVQFYFHTSSQYAVVTALSHFGT